MLKQFFDSEVRRGFLTSVVSGGAASVMNMLGQTYMGMPTNTSTVLWFYVFGYVLAYSLDILFAKREFKGARVRYTDFAYRLAYLARSILSTSFIRFIFTVILDTIFGLVFLDLAREWLDRRGVLTKWRYRNAALSAVITVVTFVAFINTLRFSWSYNDKVDPLMDVMVFAWTTMSLMLFVLYKQNRESILKKKD